MSINTKVRTTPDSVVGDAKVELERHRSHRICEATSQLDVPTSLTSAPSHLLRFHFVCCAKEVSELVEEGQRAESGQRQDLT